MSFYSQAARIIHTWIKTDVLAKDTYQSRERGEPVARVLPNKVKVSEILSACGLIRTPPKQRSIRDYPRKMVKRFLPVL